MVNEGVIEEGESPSRIAKSGKIELYTVVALAENSLGVLARACSIMSRRRLNIESLNAYETHVKGLSRFTIVVSGDELQVLKIIEQIRRIVEVREAHYYRDEELVYQEVGMARIVCETSQSVKTLAKFAKDQNAMVTPSDDNNWVIEKSGKESEITEFFLALKPFEVREHARSGRIALPRGTSGVEPRA